MEYGISPPGFRLPETTRLGTVRLQVGDLGRARDYYQTVLGMRAMADGEGELGLAAGAGERPLLVLRERRGARPVPPRGAWGLYHFALLLPSRAELGRFAAHLRGLGVRPGMADHAVSEALYLHEPDGLGIEVYADRPRAQWPIRGRELAMTTEPLDLAGLLAAGEGGEWDGLPAGSVMGHIHLHVGDLAAAAGFYHRALGLDQVVWSYPGALFLSAGGYHHHLGVNTWSPGPAAADDQARLLAWELVVPGAAAAAAESLRRAGYPVERDAEGWRVVDPWGTRLRLTGEG